MFTRISAYRDFGVWTEDHSVKAFIQVTLGRPPQEAKPPPCCRAVPTGYLTKLDDKDPEAEAIDCEYPHHQYIHTNGALLCCDNGGWARTPSKPDSPSG